MKGVGTTRVFEKVFRSVLYYFGCRLFLVIEFFRVTCDRDLEGIVAKKKWGHYGEGWWKIRNPKYSQYGGRHELFEKRMSATASQ
jgi:hypothetical protein